MTPRVMALSGGIGGAKLVLGLAQILHGEELMVVANTGDDFAHCGLHICPDIDTLLYTLGGVADPVRGWGLAGETWDFMERLRRERPEEAWFQLGDKDLQTHRFRTEALGQGLTLTEVTAAMAKRYGVGAAILPMSDDPVRTFVQVEIGGSRSWLPFQEYFVCLRCEPPVRALEYRGSAAAALQPRLMSARTAQLEAIVIGPSNPWFSIDPILAVPGMRETLRACDVPVIAVSPIVGGRALKGPTAKIMHELGFAVDVLTVARHYRGLVDGLVIDEADRDARSAIEDLGIQVGVAATVMVSLEDRVRLAQDCLAFTAGLSRGSCAGPSSA